MLFFFIIIYNAEILISIVTQKKKKGKLCILNFNKNEQMIPCAYISIATNNCILSSLSFI